MAPCGAGAAATEGAEAAGIGRGPARRPRPRRGSAAPPSCWASSSSSSWRPTAAGSTRRRRVLLAFVGSTALLGTGLYLHEQQGRTQAALAAVATAIAALYITLTAATGLYDLIDPALALVFAGLVGAVATAIAVRWDEPVVAGLGIVGALLAPVFVDAGTDSTALAFMTIALVSAVGVLLWRRWSWLGVAAFLVSAPQLGVWLYEEYSDNLGLALCVLVGFWLLYVVAAIGYELREPTADLRIFSASLLLANAALVAGAGWAMLDDTGHSDAATVWVIGAAAVHIGGAIPAYGGRMSKEIAALIMAVGTALAALGLALAIDGPALVAAWSAEALVLAWAARRFGDPRGQIASAAFFALAVAHTIAFEAPPDALRFGLDDFGSAAIAVVIVGATAAALSRLSALPELRAAYLGIAATAALYLPSLAIVSAFEGDELEPGQTPQVLLSAFWAVAGLTGIVVGLLRGRADASSRRARAAPARRRQGLRLRPLRARVDLPRALVHRSRPTAARRRVRLPADPQGGRRVRRAPRRRRAGPARRRDRRARSTRRAIAGSGRSKPRAGSRHSSRTGRCTSTPRSASAT